jgi:ribose/xylose/arabinose/galactoside ABC-type transport system permease subunit
MSSSETLGAAAAHRRDGLGQRALRALSFRNIGAVYVWVIIVIVFTVWASETFPTWATVRQVLDGNAVTGLVALSLVIPLSARIFDLSVAYIAALSGVTAAYFIHHGVGVPGAIVLALAVSLLVGLCNALVVVVMGVDSFIGTLASGSLIQAFITLVTNDISINDPKISTGGFAKVAQQSVGGITLPVFYALAVAILIWFALEHTATGRRIYATGFNAESARLAGVRINRLRFASLLVSAVIAGIAGIVLASTIGSGSPTAGTPYLLPAFAAAFLGATQLRGGRFNAWGTLIAVILLGTGITGLGLAAAPNYSANMFTGVVLIAALAITGAQRRGLRSGGWRQRFRRTIREPAIAPASEPPPTSTDHA